MENIFNPPFPSIILQPQKLRPVRGAQPFLSRASLTPPPTWAGVELLNYLSSLYQVQVISLLEKKVWKSLYFDCSDFHAK